MSGIDKLIDDMELEEKIKSLPFVPMGLWVVVQRDPTKESTKGGLVVPNAYQVKTNRGTVLAVGVGMNTDYGATRYVTSHIKPGSVIQWDAGQMGHDIEVQGETYTFIPSSVIVLVEKP